MRPFASAVETWASLPGIDRITAWTRVAELGADRTPFPSAAHAASWAGLCPGQEESAGKRRSGRTRPGEPMAPARMDAGRLGSQPDQGIVLPGFLPPAGRPQRQTARHCRRRPGAAVHRLPAVVDRAEVFGSGRGLLRTLGCRAAHQALGQAIGEVRTPGFSSTRGLISFPAVRSQASWTVRIFRRENHKDIYGLHYSRGCPGALIEAWL